MKKMLMSFCLAALTTVSCADYIKVDVHRFQPPIVRNDVPTNVPNSRIPSVLERVGLNPFVPVVDTFNHKGKLLASWNPSLRGDVSVVPTIIVMHGGHGVSGGNVQTALKMRERYDANVLILDSYWSRGASENWDTWTNMGANMRMLDALAAARFTKAQGGDPIKTYLVGDSQGGWTVLRTFSDHEFSDEVKELYAGGVALYPNCYVTEHWWDAAPNKSGDAAVAPKLGGYTQPVLVFTGTADQATPVSQCNVEKTLKAAEKWIVFKDATHAWDNPPNGPGRAQTDGQCNRALNKYNHFPMCYSESLTTETFNQVDAFLLKHHAVPGQPLASSQYSGDLPQKYLEAEIERLTALGVNK